MENWESFDGQLALKGVDPRDWTLRRLLNAVEYQVLSSATDEKEAAKLRAKLYTPPRQVPARRQQADTAAPEAPRPRRPKAPPMAAQSTADILAMAAEQDAQIGRR